MSYTPTQVPDVKLPQTISDYMEANLPDILGFSQSGAATIQFENLAKMGGNTVSLRKFKEDLTAPEADDGTESNAAKLESLLDQLVIRRQRRTRGVDRAVRAALGQGNQDAVMQELARQTTYYWTRWFTSALVKVLTGLFDGTSGVLRTTHRKVSVGSTANNRKYLEFGTLIDAATLHGDNMERLAILLTPSKTWADLKKQNLAKVTYELLKDGFGEVVRDERGAPVNAIYFDGKRVLITDEYPVDSSGANPIYTSFLVRPGALAFAMQQDIETFLSYLPLRNSDVLVQPVAYAAHVLGVAWNGSTVPSSVQAGPSDADLATPGSWTKADVDKNIGVIAVQTNATN